MGTFKVWFAMLSDGFKTLLCEPSADGTPHPYNLMFEDTAMFIHQNHWADYKARRRVRRLQQKLKERRAFGFAMYFDGEDNVQARFVDIFLDACRVLMLEPGFRHIVLVMCFKPEGASPPDARWSVESERIS